MSTGESTAPWDLAELELYIRSGEVDEAKLALSRIEAEHRDDPDVAAALYRKIRYLAASESARATHSGSDSRSKRSPASVGAT